MLSHRISSKDNTSFYPLLYHLNECPTSDRFQDWQIQAITGGRNNLLYRVSGPDGEFAVKFTIRDERDRAGREYFGLLALQQAGLKIAPIPLLLERERFNQPVVVQTWLEGTVADALPRAQTSWRCLLQHYATLHTVTSAQVNLPLPPATLNARSAIGMLGAIEQQLTVIPLAEHPDSLRRYNDLICATQFPTWAEPAIVLCRNDANLRNFVRRQNTWLSVDWENSGWGDAAFEIADLMTHPAYVSVPLADWESIIEIYCHLKHDAEIVARIRVYRYLMLIWWLARLVRARYEIPRGLEKRLVAPQDDWLAHNQRLYQHYLTQAEAVRQMKWVDSIKWG